MNSWLDTPAPDWVMALFFAFMGILAMIVLAWGFFSGSERSKRLKERFAAWFVAYFGIGEYIIYRAEQSIEGLIPTGKMAEIEGRLSQLIDEIEAQKEVTSIAIKTAANAQAETGKLRNELMNERLSRLSTPRRD